VLSLLVIEHNLDVIKSAELADSTSDPKGATRAGKDQSRQGTPEQVARKTPNRHTGRFLARAFKRKWAGQSVREWRIQNQQGPFGYNFQRSQNSCG